MIEQSLHVTFDEKPEISNNSGLMEIPICLKYVRFRHN